MLGCDRSPRLPLLLSLLVPLACGKETATPTDAPPPAAEAPTSSLPDRDPALAHRLVEEEGALLLDVRTPQEYEEGHVEGAHNIPHDEVEARIEEIRTLTRGEPDTPIVVYCRSGRRATTAKETLLKQGYTQVTNLGGMTDW